jgi:intracellular septation protein
MKFLYDFFPIILFFVVYKLYGIYAATATAMLASFIQVIYYRIRYNTFERMQLVTLILIAILGSATLISHNPIFIKWKPTAVYWVFALAFMCSHFIGKKPLIHYMLGSKIELPTIAWKTLNISWIAFFVLMGIANIWVAYTCSTNTWVNFKLFGVLGLTVVFALIQAIYLARFFKNE